ncbi:MAG: fluoride efflux transporter CrcB [Planctomycetota bacterium]
MPAWLMQTILIAAGGATGACLRAGLNAIGKRHFADTPWPIATFTANVVGCLAIGVLHVWLAAKFADRSELRAALIVGVLGALTTFSSYGLEVAQLAEDKRYLAAVGYVLASNAIGIALVIAGLRLGRLI